MPRRRWNRALLGAAAMASATAAIGACESNNNGFGANNSGCDASPAAGQQLTSGAAGGAGGGDLLNLGGMDAGPPALDASGLCGDELHTIINNAPNLYFVFDVSGSMGDPVDGGFTKYQSVDNSAELLLRTLGKLINVGAAVFPLNATDTDSCHVGGQVFPVSPGDPVSPIAGPTTKGFIGATDREPSGGTPTAATLVALKPGLTALKGTTIVLLATDGGPNCDANALCSSSGCIDNIEGTCALGGGANCCGPGGPDGPEGCLDEDPTVAAIADLAKAGILVYVIGVPGSEFYSSALDQMAIAGGAPQPGSPSYYAVDDLGGLEHVFQSIASVVVSCDFLLEDPPKDEQHTNVWLDGIELPADPKQGWIWKSQDVIELVGTACNQLKSGAVGQVQIVSGCPTEMPK